MVGLPYNPTRTEIVGFYLGLAAVVAAVWIVAAAIAPPARPSPGVLAFAAAAFLCMTCTRAGRLGYRIWHRLARRLGSFGARYLLLVWYVFVICPVGWLSSGSTRRRPPPAWQPKAPLAPETYASVYGGGAQAPSGQTWRRVVRWAAATGNLWACALVPLFALLALDDRERDDEAPREIYTLF
jgi:hypothetical protein